MTPAWILDVLAALMLVVAAVSAARIVLATPWRRGKSAADTDVAHVLMAIAMAGMLTPSLGTLPDAAWEVVFCLLAAWFAWRVARAARTSGLRALAGGHCAPHLVHSASMLYMFLAAAAASPGRAGAEGMGGMSAAGGPAAMTLSLPTLAFVFAFILVGYAVWDVDQLSGRRYATVARVTLAGAGQVGPIPAGAGPATVPVTVDAGHTPDGLAMDDRADPAPAPARVAGDHDGGGTARLGGAAGFLLSPAVTVGCRIAMGVTMAFMLLIAL